jgi:hypothetical protein
MGHTHKMQRDYEPVAEYKSRKNKSEKYIDKHKKAIYNIVSSAEDLDDDFDDDVLDHESDNISFIHRK